MRAAVKLVIELSYVEAVNLRTRLANLPSAYLTGTLETLLEKLDEALGEVGADE